MQALTYQVVYRRQVSAGCAACLHKCLDGVLKLLVKRTSWAVALLSHLCCNRVTMQCHIPFTHQSLPLHTDACHHHVWATATLTFQYSPGQPSADKGHATAQILTDVEFERTAQQRNCKQVVCMTWLFAKIN